MCQALWMVLGSKINKIPAFVESAFKRGSAGEQESMLIICSLTKMKLYFSEVYYKIIIFKPHIKKFKLSSVTLRIRIMLLFYFNHI